VSQRRSRHQKFDQAIVKKLPLGYRGGAEHLRAFSLQGDKRHEKLTCLTHIVNSAGPKTHTEARRSEICVFHW